MSRWARRTDTTHAPIRKALRKVYGRENVFDSHRLGGDFPDLIVGAQGRTVLVENKTPTRLGGGVKGSAISEGQKRFARTWNGGPVVQATSPEQAVSAVQAALNGSASRGT